MPRHVVAGDYRPIFDIPLQKVKAFGMHAAQDARPVIKRDGVLPGIKHRLQCLYIAARKGAINVACPVEDVAQAAHVRFSGRAPTRG